MSEKSHVRRVKVPVASIPEAHIWLSDPALGSGVQTCDCQRASGARNIHAQDAKMEILVTSRSESIRKCLRKCIGSVLSILPTCRRRSC